MYTAWSGPVWCVTPSKALMADIIREAGDLQGICATD